MTNLKEFTVSSARPLPVILMTDISGSMAVDGKIDVLNSAVVEMQVAFAEEGDGRAEIHLAVVTSAARLRYMCPSHRQPTFSGHRRWPTA